MRSKHHDEAIKESDSFFNSLFDPSSNGHIFFKQVESFVNGGDFDREKIAKYLNFDSREDFDFSTISNVSEIYPLLLDNISHIEEEDIDIIKYIYNTLNFLCTLSRTNADLSFFADPECISFLIAHICSAVETFSEGGAIMDRNYFIAYDAGHLIIRFINILIEKEFEIYAIALENGILDQFMNLIRSFGTEESGANSTDGILPDVIDVSVYFCHLVMNKEEEQENEDLLAAFWEFGVFLITFPLHTCDLISAGLALLSEICEKGFRTELSPEFINIICDLGLDGCIIIRTLFDFIRNYGEELATALTQTEFYENIMSDLENDNLTCAYVLQFLADVQLTLDSNQIIQSIFNFIIDSTSIEVKSAAIAYLAFYITTLTQSSLLTYLNQGYLPEIADVMLQGNNKTIINACIILSNIITAANAFQRKSDEFSMVEETISSVDQTLLDDESSIAIQQLIEIIPE